MQVQSGPMPIYGGLFAIAKCPHAPTPPPVSNEHSRSDRIILGPNCSLDTGGGGMWGPLCHCKMSPCPHMRTFLPVQSVPAPLYGPLIAGAKCPHAHIYGAFLLVQSVPMPRYVGLFCQCKESPCLYMGAFLPLKSVPLPVYGGPFATAKCHHAHINILGPFCQCKVFPCPSMGAFLLVQNVPMPTYGGRFASAKFPHAHIWAVFASANCHYAHVCGPFCHCKGFPCLYVCVCVCVCMGALLPMQSVTMPIYRGFFPIAKCLHARI